MGDSRIAGILPPPDGNRGQKPDRRLALFLDLLRPHGWTIGLGLFVLLVLDVVQVLLPLAVKAVVDRVEASVTGVDPGAWGPAETKAVVLIFLVAGILVFGLRYAWRVLIFGASRRVERDLRARLYDRLASVPISFYDKHQVGDLMGRASNDIEAVRNMSGILVVVAFDGIVWGVLTLGFMFWLDWKLTLAVLIPFPAVVVFTKFMGAAFHTRFRELQERFSRLSAAVEEAAGGILALKGFGQELGEAGLLTRRASSVRDSGYRLASLEAWFEPVFRSAGGIGSAILLAYGGARVLSGVLSVGTLAAFLQYFGYLVWPFMALGFMVNLYQRGTASLLRVQDLLDVEPEPRPAGPLPAGPAFAFEGVDFSYGNGPSVLSGVRFAAGPGQRVGVVGATGAGKTTLFRLLLGLYPAPPGTVVVGGIPVEEADLQAWRRMTAWSPQDAVTFSDSVRHNLTLGKEMDEETLWDCLEVAALAADVRAMPEGMESRVGERGISLSGGQRQRLALARTLAQGRPLLLLDDALTAVDAETEDRILSRLAEAIGGRTVVVATHRVSALAGFDAVLVLGDDGEQVAFGPPAELLETCAPFRRMWRLSTGEAAA